MIVRCCALLVSFSSIVDESKGVMLIQPVAAKSLPAQRPCEQRPKLFLINQTYSSLTDACSVIIDLSASYAAIHPIELSVQRGRGPERGTVWNHLCTFQPRAVY